jgi:pimeloyl-ACP methyl ester carboxylesterase
LLIFTSIDNLGSSIQNQPSKMSNPMSAIIIQDEIVHYEVLGRGRPMIFLHGWVGSWRYWIPAMQAASTGFRAYALDLWGFGDTAKNPAYYAIREQVSLIDAFLQEMGINKIALIGHGLGAVVGLLYASRFPRYVDRVMAVSLPNEDHAMNPRLLNASAPELVEWLLGRDPASEAARLDAPKADQKAIQISLAELKGIDLAALPLLLSSSCLMVYGQDDPAVQVPPQEQLLNLPDNIHQVVFDQSAHFPMLDEPSKFNRLMADFLTLSSSESPRQLQLKEEWKRRVR